MQLFYALNRDEELKYKDVDKIYSNWIKMSNDLFLLNICIVVKISELAVQDGQKRATKHLPSDVDKIFKPKLFENPIIQSIANNAKLKSKYKALKFDDIINTDYLSKIYDEFSKTEEYKKYLISDTTNKEHLEILLSLYRSCRANELFNEMLDDSYYNWFDDKSLIIGSFKKFLKAQPARDEFFDDFYPDKETVEDFGRFLMKTCYDTDEELSAKILPVIENWDKERVAILDMIMLKMALCEMIHCRTIPLKVTLNEYVEISKKYSTPKSKDFINGVLDKLLQSLKEEGKIEKEGRGLLE